MNVYELGLIVVAITILISGYYAVREAVRGIREIAEFFGWRW